MRTWMQGIAIMGVALSVAAPSALAQGSEHEPQRDPSTRAARMLAAADSFDRKAAYLHTRASKLRATGLELRQEAEELLATDATTPPPPPADPAAASRQGDAAEPADGGTTEPSAEDPAADPCAWDGEGDLGIDRRGDDDHKQPWDDPEAGGTPKDEACELIRMADKLEQRADAFDAAATRMEHHARKLREKAGRILGAGGQKTPQQLLERAAKLRAQAAALRAEADALRDAAFEGSSVDDDAVAKISRMELRAAALDTKANRLEARAARAAGTVE
jgi:hypothetical protein